MKPFLLFVLLVIFDPCSGEQPLAVCSSSHPFKTKENSCANFAELCIKSGDIECDNAQSACAQCPPSNFSILVFKEIQILKDNQTNENLKIENITVSMINVQNQLQKTISMINVQNQLENSNFLIKLFGIILIALLCGLLISIIIVFRLYLYMPTKSLHNITDDGEEKLLNIPEQKISILDQHENEKWKNENITEFFKQMEIVPSSSKSVYEFLTDVGTQNKSISERLLVLEEELKSIKLNQMQPNEISTISQKNIEKIVNNLGSKIKDQIEELKKEARFLNATKLKTKFQINGTSSVIELCIHEGDNIVKIKKQICSKWAEAKPHFIKIMKLSYSGRIFDDNQYLLSYGISKFETITCDLDHSINHGSILILKIHGNQDMPEYIQVHNYQTISNIKEIFANLYNLSDLVILKDLNKYEILNDKSTIKECSLMDEDWIKVVKREKGKITIRSIFEENESLVVEYSNTDQVSSIKKSVVNKFQSNPDNFVLFLNNQHLPEDKYIFDLNIKNENALRFCLLLSSKTLEYDSKTSFETGYFSDLFEAKDQMTEREFIIKRYNKLLFSNLKDNQIFLNELVTCLITKSRPRFIQLYNVFKEDDFLFIAEEKITGGSIRKYSKNNYPLPEEEIVRLSKQILEGLQYLHSNGIIFRDLKASNILLDTNKNLKLPSFSFSKYVYTDNPIISSKETPFRYVAPEILRKDKYDSKADVWSFGIILIELVSGDKPLPNLTEIQARELILKGEKVEFKCFEGMSATLKSFINSCIKSDPKERRTIEKLIQDRF